MGRIGLPIDIAKVAVLQASGDAASATASATSNKLTSFHCSKKWFEFCPVWGAELEKPITEMLSAFLFSFFAIFVQMKHHFGDLLDRTDSYWTMVPNRERYAYAANIDIADKNDVKILTISKDHANWEQVFKCPNIEELTLHNPSAEQVEKIQQLKSLKRLRVTFFRAKNIDFVGALYNLEEIVFEYVSGFSDLSPLQKLPKLRSLHLENLRRVSNFDGLKGINSLKYLHIDGTLDWKQPIENFLFLAGLRNLEVFSLRFVTSNADFPAFLPIVDLKNLKKINIGRATFKTNEYAFLQVALPQVDGIEWDLCWDYNDNFEFLGKRAGFVKKNNPNAKERCDAFVDLYNKMKTEAGEIVKKHK